MSTFEALLQLGNLKAVSLSGAQTVGNCDILAIHLFATMKLR